jgi:hypothetical protein
MADVTGPTSSMPGARHPVPKGQMCDDHPDRIATHRVQGETDSFGSELIDMCEQCHDEYVKAVATAAAEEAMGRCDWCNSEATDLRNKRDFEEGMSGRIYRVCGKCVAAESARLKEEMDQYYDDRDYDDRDYDD